MRILQQAREVFERRQFKLWDDFSYYTSGELWTNLAVDGGVTAFAESDAVSGVIQGATGATDNNEIGIFTTVEQFLLSADRPIYGCALLQYTEANTDDANVAVGFANAAGANLLSDDGAGDNINSSGILIFKVDGGTVWRCACENNGTIVETESTRTAGGATYQLLEIFGSPVDGTNYSFTYFVDGVELRDTNNRPIQHTLAYASATEMDFGAYVKAGSANSETLNIDFLGAVQLRQRGASVIL